MCNEQRFSESGAPIAPSRCAEYIALKEENDELRFKVDINRTGIMVLDKRVESLEAENARLRSALCEYQLRCWTLSYRTAMWFRPLLGDEDEDWSDEMEMEE